MVISLALHSSFCSKYTKNWLFDYRKRKYDQKRMKIQKHSDVMYITRNGETIQLKSMLILSIISGGLLLYLNVTPFMTYTSNKILNNVSYSHKVDFLTTEKLAGFKMKSWQVFKQKVGRFYPKNRVPPLVQKFIAGLSARWM